MTRQGTSYFVSENAVVKYYKPYDETKTGVKILVSWRVKDFCIRN